MSLQLDLVFHLIRYLHSLLSDDADAGGCGLDHGDVVAPVADGRGSLPGVVLDQPDHVRFLFEKRLMLEEDTDMTSALCIGMGNPEMLRLLLSRTRIHDSNRSGLRT